MAILALTMGPHLGIIMVPTVHSVGAAGTITFKAVGANGNVRWKLISSNLPAEWDDALNVSGGQATLETDEIEVPGTFSVTVQCTDESRVPVVRTFDVRVMALPLNISGSFPTWAQGVPATGALLISGGAPPYSGLTITSGALPDGVSLSIVGNQIVASGSPTTVFEEWSATVEVVDSDETPASIAVGGVVARLWTPADLAVAANIWLDHTTSVTDVSGNASAWSNAGSVGGSFDQASDSSRPQILSAELNGHRVLRFDGTDDHLRDSSSVTRGLFSSVSSGWMFTIVRRRATSPKAACIFQSRTNSTAGRFSCYSGSTAEGHYNSAALVARRVDGDSSGVIRSSDSYGTDWAILRFAQNWGSGQGSIYTDGTLSVSGATTSAGVTSSSLSNAGVFIGSEGTTTYSDNDIACIIVGAGSFPTTDEYQRLEGYYAHTYGLESNLPVDHPYRYAPPVVMP